MVGFYRNVTNSNKKSSVQKYIMEMTWLSDLIAWLLSPQKLFKESQRIIKTNLESTILFLEPHNKNELW